ncbi:ABC transporter ATP-binding protein [Acidaminobacter sp. JC074]|uniref:ABC transporter ATP-binding protein n=1 Tax=Acidaminobacter sp. JC074 TaxID=2530199 RepID=UPI001F110942|nr:ABC transporter ATP-binding protein [Acidaminobacter sp. JC074]MCH4886022.1 ABC transporter ATP-binding protein [Acidaminobacter sp. JC074]
MNKALTLDKLHVSYGNIKALKGIDIHIEEGKIVALLGANGAGKTTTLKSISGLVQAQSGHIKMHDDTISNLSPSKITQKGIIQSPEGRQIFPELTVEENLKIGAFTVKNKQEIKANYKSVYGYFPVLKERKKQIAGTLSGGEQQMLAIGRALMASPKILLLDEPSLGLAPLIVKDIFRIIKEINEKGTTVLIVEQNALQTLKIADYAYVLEVGEVSMEGPANTLIKDKKLIDAYLGGH